MCPIYTKRTTTRNLLLRTAVMYTMSMGMITDMSILIKRRSKKSANRRNKSINMNIITSKHMEDIITTMAVTIMGMVTIMVMEWAQWTLGMVRCMAWVTATAADMAMADMDLLVNSATCLR